MWILTATGRVLDGDSIMFLSFSEFCYGYDSGNGCVAGSNLPDCRSKDDNFTLMNGDFTLMNGDFTPGTFEVTPDDNSRLSFSDCMVRCWNDCLCLAFDFRDNGVGCNIWTGTKSANFVVNPQGTSVRKYMLLSLTLSKGKIILIDSVICWLIVMYYYNFIFFIIQINSWPYYYYYY
ncbi:putative PAN/Apple domain-containing protein [Helianthus anomalus]